MKETWLPIPDYIGRYSISDMGNVLSMNWNRTGLVCLLQQNNNPNGYPTVGLSNGSRETHKTHPVHRLIMLSFVGPRPKGLYINHKNGIKEDNRLSNLEYCTPSQNAQHAYDTGLQLPTSGEKNGQSKLTDILVVEIKNKIAAGIEQKLLANEYGVSRATICMIATGKRWSHLSKTLQ
jgi:HNH endonuclease/NUMOD4 motif